MIVMANLLILSLWMTAVTAAPELSGMRIGQTADKTRVVFDLDQLDQYRVSTLSNPSRIVVDFYKTSNQLSFNKKVITDARLFKIRVSDSRQRTRVVLDLHKHGQHKAFTLSNKRSSKSRLVIDLTDSTAPSQTTAKASKPAAVKLAKQAPAKVTHKVTPKLGAKSATKAVTKVAKSSALKSSAKLASKSSSNPLVKPAVKSMAKSTPKTVTKTVAKAAPKTGIQLAQTSTAKPVKKTAVKKVTPLVDMATVKTVTPKQSVKVAKVAPKSSPKAESAVKSLLSKDSAVFSKPKMLVIAVDAGHGGKDVGAIGHNKLHEKDATLKMAKELKRLIDRQPGMRAVLTRTKDVFIPLKERVSIAKAQDADMFISIHADAFHDHSVRGGSVYVLSRGGASSVMAKLLAQSENASLQDIKLEGRDEDVAFALSDLTREANIRASRKLASTVLGEMQKKVKMHKHSVQSAGFAVLKSIDMPSLLIETAFISNPHEARNLMSSSFQTKMASAIVKGLSKFVTKNAQKPRWGESLYVHYKVQPGDTLSQIAENYQVSTKLLKRLNHIKNSNELYVGRNVKIPLSDKVVAGL
ncbi:MAG: AMIN domain-containing protein [Gammaproteobacteria bacterium]|nr:AMIN domain-containing protein [Gammaproteobacteria bacterium]